MSLEVFRWTKHAKSVGKICETASINAKQAKKYLKFKLKVDRFQKNGNDIFIYQQH